MIVDRNADQGKVLAELRDDLGLYEEVPQISAAHVTNPVMLDPEDSTVALCVHDDANRRAHLVWFPTSLVEPNENEDTAAGAIARAQLVLGATYN